MSAHVAELQVLLEGVALPADKDDLLRRAREERADASTLELLERLPDREYGSLDEVGEALYPVQPVRSRSPQAPSPESGLPPGGEAYTNPSPEPGRVRERGPSG
jgi:Protein of unknown function (DUF2795)